SAWGFGLDLGAIVLLDQWRLGLMLRDVSTTFNAWTHNAEMVREVYSRTNNVVPLNSIELTLPRAIFSINRDFYVNNDFTVQAVLDLDMTFDGKRNTVLNSEIISVDPRMGLEVGYRNI